LDDIKEEIAPEGGKLDRAWEKIKEEEEKVAEKIANEASTDFGKLVDLIQENQDKENK
jgi:hypothetical protein